MSDISQILSQMQAGDGQAAEQLLPLVYDELRRLAAARLAHERPGQTLDATALVHEAYIRLVDGSPSLPWDSRGHFFAAAAEAMRRILLNRARDKQRIKRGGERRRVDLATVQVATATPEDELLAVDEALQILEAEDRVCAQLVKLRFYAGLSQKEAAAALEIPRRTADRHWAYARAWLYQKLCD